MMKKKLFFCKPFCCEITTLLTYYLLYAPSFSGWGSVLSRICTGRQAGGQTGEQARGFILSAQDFFLPLFFVLGVEQEQEQKVKTTAM